MAEHSKDDVSRDLAQKQWSDVVRTQIHFNEIIHRTRQLTATVVLASFGGAIAWFVTKPNLHLSIPLVCLGWIFMLVGFLMDRFYYYKLLLAAVEAAERLERDYDLPAKLSVALSKAVSRHHAVLVINLFYIGGVVIGAALIAFFNLAITYENPIVGV